MVKSTFSPPEWNKIFYSNGLSDHKVTNETHRGQCDCGSENNKVPPDGREVGVQIPTLHCWQLPT